MPRCRLPPATDGYDSGPWRSARPRTAATTRVLRSRTRACAMRSIRAGFEPAIACVRPTWRNGSASAERRSATRSNAWRATVSSRRRPAASAARRQRWRLRERACPGAQRAGKAGARPIQQGRCIRTGHFAANGGDPPGPHYGQDGSVQPLGPGARGAYGGAGICRTDDACDLPINRTCNTPPTPATRPRDQNRFPCSHRMGWRDQICCRCSPKPRPRAVGLRS